VSHSNENSTNQSASSEGEAAPGPLSSGVEAESIQATEVADVQADPAPTFFDAYLGFLRWVRGLVFQPAPSAQDKPRRDAVARRLRASDRYSALG